MEQSSVSLEEDQVKQVEESALLQSICKTEADEDYQWLQEHFKDNYKYIETLLQSMEKFLKSPIEPPFPLFLNVYNLLDSNFLPGLGIGVFHTAIQILDNEYAFGGHQFDETGIYSIKAKSLENAKFYKQIYMSHIFKSKRDICKDILDSAIKYKGPEYNILHNNCNDFTNEICKKLVDQENPKWINRIAKIGGVFMKDMSAGNLAQTVAYQTDDKDKKKLAEQQVKDKKQKQSNDQQQQKAEQQNKNKSKQQQKKPQQRRRNGVE